MVTLIVNTVLAKYQSEHTGTQGDDWITLTREVAPPTLCEYGGIGRRNGLNLIFD